MMTKGIKLSDPIINYPSLREHGFEHIDKWLCECEKRNDTYAIKWYLRYLDKTINELLTRLDDNNASIIRRGMKLLDHWEGEYKFPNLKK